MNINALHESRVFLNLEDIFARDNSGLLDDVKISQKTNTTNNNLLNNFNKIVGFFEKKGYPPSLDSDDFDEELLAIALESFRNNAEQKSALSAYDKHELLKDS